MIRQWLHRILLGTLAAALLGACMGGVEAAIAVRSSVTEMLNALLRLEFWAWNAGLAGALGAGVGLALAAGFGGVLGHSEEHREFTFQTGRDPRYPWLPFVLGGTALLLGVGQLLPWVADGLTLGRGGARLATGGGLLLVGVVLLGLLSWRWLARFDTEGRGVALVLLGLPTVLTLSMAITVSSPLRGGEGELVRQREGLPNLLLITVDALRADHVGPGSRVLTPTLDWLAKRGVSFTQATTPSTSESPPLGALLSGHHPLSSGFLTDGQALPPSLPRRDEPLPSLPARLAAEGYATGAFVSSRGLDGRETGLVRGFGVYDDGVGERFRGSNRLSLFRLLGWLRGGGGDVLPAGDVLRSSGDTIDRLGEWLAYHERENWFLWPHLSDPRSPEVPLEAPPGSLIDPIPGREGRAYGVRVARTDAQLGAMLDQLESDGLLEHTVVAVVGTRGYVPGGGAPTVGDPWSQVPVVLWGGAVPRGGRVDDQVRLQDLTATLLSLVGFRKHRVGDGVSLVPLLEGRPLAPLQAMTLSPPRGDGKCSIAVRTPAWKYTRHPKGTSYWYDLREDPRELHDVSEQRAEDVERQGADLDELLGRHVPQAVVPTLGPGRAQRLRALEAAR